MGALDKLNQKANTETINLSHIRKEEEKRTVSPRKANVKNSSAEKNSSAASKATPIKKEAEKTEPKKVASTQKKTSTTKDKEKKIEPKPARQNGKHPGGRTNTRGEAGKDYKMINIAVPTEVYNKIKEKSGGNMTYFINSLFRNAIEN